MIPNPIEDEGAVSTNTVLVKLPTLVPDNLAKFKGGVMVMTLSATFVILTLLIALDVAIVSDSMNNSSSIFQLNALSTVIVSELAAAGNVKKVFLVFSNPQKHAEFVLSIDELPLTNIPAAVLLDKEIDAVTFDMGSSRVPQSQKLLLVKGTSPPTHTRPKAVSAVFSVLDALNLPPLNIIEALFAVTVVVPVKFPFP